MRKFRNHETWEELPEEFETVGIATVKIRSNGPATLYEVRENSQSYPCGFCDQEEIELLFAPSYLPRKFQVICDPGITCWMSSRPLPHISPRTETEKFTTFDRPSPLSPEMQAIYRLSRQNEIERENQRNEMEKREHSFLAQIRKLSQKTPAPKSTDEGKNGSGGIQKPSERRNDAQEGDPPEPASRERDTPSSRSSGEKGVPRKSTTENSANHDGE